MSIAYILTWGAIACALVGIFAGLTKHYRLLFSSVAAMFALIGIAQLIAGQPRWFGIASFAALMLGAAMNIAQAIKSRS